MGHHRTSVDSRARGATFLLAAAVLLITVGACANPRAASPVSADPLPAPTGAPAITGGMPSALWQTLPVTDSEGKTFTLGELTGTPVFVEFFATWCPTCRAQLGSTNAAATTAGSTATFVALSTETDLGPADMAKYKADNAFDDIRFGVMSPQLLAAVVDALGHDAANPPATPHVVVSATGEVGELQTGAADPATILGSLAGS